MMNNTNNKFKLILWGSISLLCIIVFLIVWFINRNKPFLSTILWYIIILGILGVLAGIVFLILWLFKKQKIDLLYVMRTQILESCKLNAPEEKSPVFLYDNQSTKYVGEFIGYSMIKTADWMNYIDEKNQDEDKFFRQLTKDKIKDNEGYLYIFAIKPRFGQTELILLLEDDFNGIDNNPILLFGKGFSPKMYEFIYLSKHYDMAQSIELPMKNLVYKYGLEHNMRELVSIIDNAIDVDAQFRKEQEKANIDDFRPNSGGGGS